MGGGGQCERIVRSVDGAHGASDGVAVDSPGQHRSAKRERRIAIGRTRVTHRIGQRLRRDRQATGVGIGDGVVAGAEAAAGGCAWHDLPQPFTAAIIADRAMRRTCCAARGQRHAADGVAIGQVSRIIQCAGSVAYLDRKSAAA